MNNIRTRFAPSPTGFLHIGSLRTAIFNWLYARAKNGSFLLRIEDTDVERSTNEFTEAIVKSLKWMNITSDEKSILQSENIEAHQHAAMSLVEQGKAYYCYCSKKELEEMRNQATGNKEAFKYDRRCYLNPPQNSAQKPVVRLLAKQDGFTEFNDLVQGHIKINNNQMDDMVLLRSDGTPTYMLAVVVDDINMNITHIIRGDDHLTNTFRQIQLYNALGKKIPEFAHIPLINGSDGTKMSKRHGAVDVNEYEKMGILPEAFFNYLIRLGWAHGNDEIISISEAIKWFDISNIGKSPARFDMSKLLHINGVYIRKTSNDELMSFFPNLDAPFYQMLKNGMEGIKIRSKTLLELKEMAKIYISETPLIADDSIEIIKENKTVLLELYQILEKFETWTEESIKELFQNYAVKNNIKLGDVAKPIRCALSGKLISPDIFEVMQIIGKDMTLKRIKNAI